METKHLLGETSARVLDAAERCMSRYGLQRVSMNDVAVEAGVSRGTVYRYFPARDDLVTAVLDRTAHAFVRASEPWVDAGPTLADQVAEAVLFVLAHRDDAAFTLELPARTDSLLAILLSVRIEPLLSAWVDFWGPRLAAAEARGELRAGLDPRRTGEWIVRLCFTFAVMPSVAVDVGDPADVRRFVRLHLEGVLA
ncbi:helix-turn-helix domain-containing protein [Spirillospora sp. NPDC047279]|uniref:TetR/AcrR family transcriptional regulator n=1 Tax=Spirillospora sp. NPDC047279 TaxID=3155478 RepID=UPI0033F9E6C4